MAKERPQVRCVALAATPIMVWLEPGGTVHCESGMGWVTTESTDVGRAQLDHVVLPGQPFSLPAGGRIILSSLQGTAQVRLTGELHKGNE